MRNGLLILLGFVDFVANVPYIRDIYKRQTKPNIASWSTLTLINAITVVASYVSHDALNTVILAVSYFIGSSTILVLALIKGTRGYTRFDLYFQVLAVAGVVFWLFLRNPNIGLATAIIVGELAALPMYRHAYRYPDEETWSTFFVASLVALGTMCLAEHISFASLAIPIDLVLGNGLMTLLIITRRKQHGNKSTKNERKAQPII